MNAGLDEIGLSYDDPLGTKAQETLYLLKNEGVLSEEDLEKYRYALNAPQLVEDRIEEIVDKAIPFYE